jgi:hypothetical protein
MNDRELMAIRADTDFTYDGRGRLLLTNEPYEAARQPAPRLFLGRTSAGQVVRVGSGLSDGVARRLESVVAALTPTGDLRLPAATLTALREVLEEDAPVTSEGGGPVYRFPASIAAPGDVVRVTVANRELVRETYPWLRDEIDDWQPCFAVVRDGAAVAVCFSSRSGARAAEAGVDTLADFRGHGFATAATRAWGAAIRTSGRVPLYSTGWGNAASQGVARRAGLVVFGADSTWS